MTLTSRIPPSPTLFPYTTLFRSRLFREAFRFRARFLQTNDGRISRFLRCDIFARALAKFLARLGDVENIVDDLKCETERASKFCDCAELFRIRVCAHRAESDRRR